MREIDYLCIGHVSHDLIGEDGIALGGTVSYASMVAQQLGRHTGILSSYSEDFKFEGFISDFDIAIQTVDSKTTTTFENIYHDKGRTQYMHDRAEVIRAADLPIAWIDTPIVHLCLIADEISNDFCARLSPSSLIGLAIQGALRITDSDNKIHSHKSDLTRYKGVDIVFLSDDDIAGLDDIMVDLTEIFPIVVVTHGADGASVIKDQVTYNFPSYPTQEVDPTGAGDVFGAAFLIEYQHTGDIWEASAFAHSAASLSVERRGVDHLPKHEEVMRRKKDYIELYHETINMMKASSQQ